MRRLLKFIAVFISLTVLVTAMVVQSSGDADFSWPTGDAVVNDVTELIRIRVTRVLVPDSVEEISNIAKANLHYVMAWENKVFHWKSLLT